MKRILLPLCLVFTLFALFLPFPFKLLPLPVRVLFDSMHLFIFLFLVLGLNYFWGKENLKLTGLIALLVAIAIEILQPLTGRSAELFDLVYDVIGTYLGLSLCKFGPTKKMVTFVASTSLALIAIPLSMPTLGYLQYKKSFPVLSDFDSNSTKPYKHIWQSGIGNKFMMDCAQTPSAGFHCKAGSDAYSTMQFAPGIMDWSSYQSLVLQLNNDKEPFFMHIRIDDNFKCEQRSCRWVDKQSIQKGFNLIKINLKNTGNLNHQKVLTLDHIIRLVIFTEKQDPAAEFFLKKVYLE